VRKSFVGLHSYTGCDSVSAFGGRGKLGALKLCIKEPKYQKALGDLGQRWMLSADLYDTLQEFTCHMCATRLPVTEVNDMRYQLFKAKRGDIESGQLPPCNDCLYFHALRANYQSCIWRRSLHNYPSIPSPEGHGWVLNEEGQLIIQWMKGPPAPDVVLEFMSCKCSRVCSHPDCQCMANGLKCTEMCKLQTCDNMKSDSEFTMEQDSSDEDDASDEE